MRPLTRHYVGLEVVRRAFAHDFIDMSALQLHISKQQWLGPQENLAVTHGKKLYILADADADARRYKLATAVKLLNYVTETERIFATRAAMLLHWNFEKWVS